MKIVGGIIGGILGAAVGALFTEVFFANSQSWPDVFVLALAVLGILSGSAFGRRLSERHAHHRQAKPS